MQDKRQKARQAAGVPLIKTAVDSGTSEATVRLYEASPDAIKDPRKRAALDKVYAGYAAQAKGVA
jgi:hypothetical protein